MLLLMSASVIVTLSTTGIAIASKKVFDYGFDYVLYPAVLLYFGYWWGGVAMTLASVVLNIGLIRLYDWVHRDLLMIERLKDLRSKTLRSRRGSLLSKVLRGSDIAAFFVLSLIEDPAIVTLYLRRGSYQYNSLSRSDWLVFIGSTVVANLAWILSLGTLYEVVKLMM